MSDRDEREVREAQEALLRAERAGDTEALERLVAEDFHGIDPGGADVDRSAVIAGYGSEAFTLDVLRVEDVRVRVLGEVGLVRGRSVMEGRVEGEPFGGAYRYRDVWARREGAWRLVASQLTPLPGDAGEA